MYEIGDYVSFNDVYWSSDWNGYEVGFPEIDVVGLYGDREGKCMFYVNAETGEILDLWTCDDDDD